MDIENYVLDNFLSKIIKIEEGQKYILEEDLGQLNLSINEKNFVLQLMKKNKIELKKEVITKDDRSPLVKDYEFGDIASNELENRDIPEIANIEYTDENVLVFEDYKKLEEFIEKEFIPNNVKMTKKRNIDDANKDFDKIVTLANGKQRNYYKKQLYPSIQLSQIINLKLSEKETEYIMKYLEEQGIVIRGKNSTIDQEYIDYDYYVTYKNQILPDNLTKDEIIQKFMLYKATKDPILKEQIILGSLRLVPYIAWKYAIAYDVDINEVESFGYEGLIEAIERFDYTKGFAFSTFAIEYIKGYIKSGRAELENSNINRGRWYDIYTECREVVEQETNQKLQDDPSLILDINELMMKVFEERGYKYSKDKNLFRIRFINQESLDTVNEEKILTYLDKDSHNLTTQEIIENITLSEDLKKVLSTLTEREQKVLKMRFGFEDGIPKTLEEVAKLFGPDVTRERIRQIEAKALRKLRHPSRSAILKGYLYDDYKTETDNLRFSSPFSNIYSTLVDVNDEEFPEQFSKEWEETTKKFKH